MTRDDEIEAIGLQRPGRATLHDRIFIRLEEQIVVGRFLPGQRLTLRGLAASLGTSLMPVRDALQRLESAGALVAQPNRTLVVPQLTGADLDELGEVRCAVEGLAAERAARRGDPAALGRLRERYRGLEREIERGSLEGFLRANWLFHLAVAEAGGPTLTSVIKSLWLRMGPTVRLSKPDGRSLALALPPHARILSAIERGDADEAREAVRDDALGCFRDRAGGRVAARNDAA